MPTQTTLGRAVEPRVQQSGEAVPAAVRAQILATEHWSLLGTRGTTWTEVMGRISIHLTVASAGSLRTSSPPGDGAGLMRTYTMGAARHMVSHVVGSTSMFMNVVNAIVAGVLGALIANAANASPTLIAIIGSLSALAYFFVMLAIGRRTFARTPIDAHFPTTTA
jgi:hypothetical protein